MTNDETQGAEGGAPPQQPGDLPVADAAAQAVHEAAQAAGGDQSQATAEEQKAQAPDPPVPSGQGDGDHGDQGAQDSPRAAEALRQDGPTLEVYVAAGYGVEGYPPSGYAEQPSAALTRYRETGEGPTEAELSEALAALEAEAEAAGEQLPAAPAGLSAEELARLRRAGPKERRQFAAGQSST